MDPDVAPVRAGQIIAEKYLVRRELGHGGMGIVMLATHLHLGTPVALKFLRPRLIVEPASFRRFQREARATARLQSEHAVRIMDAGVTTDDIPYIAMEYLEGCDLGTALEAGALPPAAAVDYVLQAAHAPGEAHAAGIVHRDLKPSNIFLAQRPDGTTQVKVTDFGIAKWGADLRESVTQSAVLLGSPGYTAPEQLRNPRDVDARADIWSLGAVLFELLAGTRPYRATTLAELVSQILMEAPAALPASVPDPLAHVVMRCLERDVRRRYQDVASLARDLIPFGSAGAAEMAARIARAVARPRPRRRVALVAPPTAGALTAADTVAAAPEPAWPRRALGGAVAVVTLAAVLAATTALLCRTGPAPGTVDAPSAPAPLVRPLALDHEVDAGVATPVEGEAEPVADPPAVASQAEPPGPPARRSRSRRSRRPRPDPAVTPDAAVDFDGDGIPDVR